MSFDELINIVDCMTMVEVVKADKETLFEGRLIDVKPNSLARYTVYNIIPCGNGKETYLEIDVY